MDLSSLWRQALQNSNQKTHLQHPTTHPERLFTLYLLRQQLSRELLSRSLPSTCEWLIGSTANCDLTLRWARLCLRSQTPFTSQLQFWPQILDSWKQQSEELPKKQVINLLEDTLPKAQLLSKFACVENYLGYLDFIASDLAPILTGKSAIGLPEINETDYPSASRVSNHSLLLFLESALPKTIFPLILPRSYLPLSLQTHKQLECVYANQQLESAVRLNTDYAQLMRWLMGLAISRGNDLPAAQQKSLMLLLFRYFYLFHGERSSRAVEMLVEGYNLVDEGVRFALTQDFALFLRTARKVGKAKMVDWLLSKSIWMSQISQKLSQRSIIGYKPENASPLSAAFSELIEVDRKSKVHRFVQVLYPHSLLFLNLELEQLDVYLRVSRMDNLHVELEQPEVVWQGKVAGKKEQVLLLVNCGIYQVEFDNSASWINSKRIRYQKALLAPLDLQPQNHYPWISSYYIEPLTSVHPSLIRRYQNSVILGSISIIKTEQSTYLLKLSNLKQVVCIIFETDSLERFMERAQKLKEQYPHHEWKIDSQLLANVPLLQQLSNLPSPNPERKKQKDLLIEIPLRY